VVCHGFKGTKDAVYLKTLAHTLAARGIAAFRFDFTNEAGESEGKIENILFTQKLRDIGAVVGYVSRQKFVDAKRIGLAGHSQGGQAILTYAPKDARVKALADLAGPSYRGEGNTGVEKTIRKQSPDAKKTGYFTLYSKTQKKTYRIKLRFYYDLMSYDTAAQIKKIKVPTLIVHGSADTSVPLVHSRRAYQLLKQPKRLVIVDGAPHSWKEAKYYRPINSIIASWFEIYL
jgi:dipeptidyl aminopeptidase/acylaminoacyl peptidase